jgi:oligoribonuclease
MSETPAMVWVDVETTGLNPFGGWLLEVGMIITAADLHQIARKSWILKFNREYMSEIADEALKMHTSSGLLFEAMASHETLASATLSMREWLDSRVGYSAMKEMPMAGSTVQFDRAWLAHHLPLVEERFHYRHIDVSTLKNLARLWYPELLKWTGDRKLHRALPDLEDSITELDYYRRHVFAGGPIKDGID